MKTLFDIQADVASGTQYILLMELGQDYCSYGFWNKQVNTIDQLKFISYDEKEAEDRLTTIIESLQEHSFQSVVICSAFPQAILSPSKFFQHQYDLLESIYDEPAQQYLNDAIPEWQIVALYSIPQWLHELAAKTFVDVQYLHVYTPALKVYNGFVADNQLSIHFTPQHFRVLLKKDSAVQLAQTYHYTTPLDVVYYLIKICSEFDLAPSSVALILSGLVEKESSLYTEIYQYFDNVHFAHPPDIKLPANEHPHYFFTSLYNLATCVS